MSKGWLGVGVRSLGGSPSLPLSQEGEGLIISEVLLGDGLENGIGFSFVGHPFTKAAEIQPSVFMRYQGRLMASMDVLIYPESTGELEPSCVMLRTEWRGSLGIHGNRDLTKFSCQLR